MLALGSKNTVTDKLLHSYSDILNYFHTFIILIHRIIISKACAVL